MQQQPPSESGWSPVDVFLSYTRSDAARLPALLDGLRRLKHQVWFDQDLSGGQEWWDEVLRRITTCDVLLLALTPDALESQACGLEVAYARALGKPVVPVMLERVLPSLLPAPLARLQVVDFTASNASGAFDLMGALAQLPPPRPLPDPLPAAPPVPVSYLSDLGEQVQAPSLTLDQQLAVVRRLRAGVRREREREGVLTIVRRLRERDDLFVATARELDHLAEELRAQPSAPDEPGQHATGRPPPGRTSSADTPPAAGGTEGAAPAPPVPPRRARRTRWVMAGVLLLAGGGAAVAAGAGSSGQVDDPGPDPVPSSSLSSSQPDRGASSGSARPTAAAVGDTCLVGDWISVDSTGTAQVAGVQLQTSGGDGTRLRITRDGRASYDSEEAEPVLGTTPTGLVLEFLVEGSSTTQLRADGRGRLRETLLTRDVVVTPSLDGEDGTPYEPDFQPYTAYRCSADTLVLSSASAVDTYERG